MRETTKKKIIFINMTVLSIVINLDGGAVPAGLVHIQRTFKLGTIEEGLLGMLVYQGIALGSLTVGPLLRYVSPLRATQASLVLNTVATLLFGAAQNTAWLLIARVSIGALQAVPAVYFPVWVDEFAPENAATLWMALVQAGAPLGIMMGYVVAGILTATASIDDPACEPIEWFFPMPAACNWRVPFYAQSCVLIFFSVGSFFVPARLYDTGSSGSSEVQPELTNVTHGARDCIAKDVASVASDASSVRPTPSAGNSRNASEVVRDSNASSNATSNNSNSTGRSVKFSHSATGGFKTSAFGEASQRTRTPSHIFLDAFTPVNVRASRMDTMRDSVRDEVDDMQEKSAASGISTSSRPAAGRTRVVSAAEVLWEMPRMSNNSQTPSIDEQAAASDSRPRSAFCRLVSSSVYMTTALGLSCLFFVVTGIQFWVTKYLIFVIGVEQDIITAAFGVTSITAPIVGVFLGGTIIDKLGGYQGAVATARTLRCCAIFAVLAASSASLCAFAPKLIGASDPTGQTGFWLTIGLIASTLLFGGAIIPAATAIIVSSVDSDLRELASAGSIFLFQQLGYAAAPLISAFIGSAAGADLAALNATLAACPGECIPGEPYLEHLTNMTPYNMTQFTDAQDKAHEYAQVEVCWAVVMCWGWFGFVFLMAAVYSAGRNVKRAQQSLASADGKDEVKSAAPKGSKGSKGSKGVGSKALPGSPCMQAGIGTASVGIEGVITSSL